MTVFRRQGTVLCLLFSLGGDKKTVPCLLWKALSPLLVSSFSIFSHNGFVKDPAIDGVSVDSDFLVFIEAECQHVSDIEIEIIQISP